MARLGAKKIWKQWAESTGASGDSLPSLGGDTLDWDEMPQVGHSFHRSLINDRVDDDHLEVWPESHWPGFALRKADVFQSDIA